MILNNHEGDYCNEKLSVLTRFIIFSNEPIISSDVFSSIPGQFRTGEYVEVEVNGDEITLSKTTPPEIKEKVSLEEKVRMLDKKQRAKLANLIDKL